MQTVREKNEVGVSYKVTKNKITYYVTDRVLTTEEFDGLPKEVQDALWKQDEGLVGVHSNDIWEELKDPGLSYCRSCADAFEGALSIGDIKFFATKKIKDNTKNG